MFDPHTTVVIANPAAAGGRVGRQFDSLVQRIQGTLGPVEVLRTQRAGHATELAREAIGRGARELLSLGGDGTHNEVVCGIVEAGLPPASVTLGILPSGTGGDFRRNLVHGQDLDGALHALQAAPVVPIDLGRCDYLDDEGRPGSRVFLNMASCGVSGLVCRIANASSKRLGGKATFFLASLQGVNRWKGCPVRVRVDGAVVAEGLSITTLAAANGRFAGGGMMFAPQALLNDGLLDVTALEYRGVVGALTISGDLYKGRQLGRPDVKNWRGADIEVETLDPERPAWVEIDGEPPGKAPVRFRVLPGAIRLRDPRPEQV